MAVVLGALALATPAGAATPAQLVSVTVTGGAVVGQTLQTVVVATGDPPPTTAYQWSRCDAIKVGTCAKIAGATADTYLISADDLGFRLVVRVTVKNAGGTDEGKSAPTDVVVAPAPPPDPTPPPPDPTPPPPDPTPTPTPSPTPAPTPDPTQPPAAGTTPPSDSTIAGPTSAPQTAVPFETASAPLEAPSLVAPAPKATPVRYLRPFPIVRIAGSSIAGGAYVQLLRVTAPRGSTVEVTCSGKRCQLRRLTLRPGHIRPFERFLPAGLTITIRISRTGYVGKYVRLVIRSRAAPERRDACLLPGRTRPSACP